MNIRHLGGRGGGRAHRTASTLAGELRGEGEVEGGGGAVTTCQPGCSHLLVHGEDIGWQQARGAHHVEVRSQEAPKNLFNTLLHEGVCVWGGGAGRGGNSSVPQHMPHEGGWGWGQ